MDPRAVPARRLATVGAVWLVGTACFLGAAGLQRSLRDAPVHGVALADPVLTVYALAFVASATVGSALVLRRDGHIVGRWFLVLATAAALGLVGDLYARDGIVAHTPSRPGAALVAHLVDPMFVWYFAPVSLALQLTPSGTSLGGRWARLPAATWLGATIAHAGGALSTRAIDPPFASVANPIGITSMAPVLDTARAVGAAVTALALVLGGASALTRAARADAAERARLRWLTAAVVPLPVYVVAAFVWRRDNNRTPLLLATAGWMVAVPCATWFCIARHHLFGIDGVLTRTLRHLALSATIVATYVTAVIAVGAVIGGHDDVTAVAPVFATLAAVSVALPARRAIQAAVDRRFARRRFDAVRLVRAGVRDPAATLAVDELLRRALGDARVRVHYPLPDDGGWVDATGAPAADGAPSVPVQRGAVTIARIEHDPGRTDPALVHVVADEALPELDNARLRAALASRLLDVAESRARIAAAQLEERRRIERNLHDGAQQRLLALGMELRTAQINGSPARVRAAVDTGIELARAALEELRALANGLCPAVLSDGGLTAALDDLANASPVPVVVCATRRRYATDVEQTAWFVVSEALANAIKHASATVITIDATDDDGRLSLTVADDGCGGADPNGSGLRGLRDRVEAARGVLEVRSPAGGGTTIRSVLPCAP